jgi:hypothetical protein
MKAEQKRHLSRGQRRAVDVRPISTRAALPTCTGGLLQCTICPKLLSSSDVAVRSHLRGHVHRKELAAEDVLGNHLEIQGRVLNPRYIEWKEGKEATNGEA